MGNIKINREGEISENNKGTKMKIIKYNGARDIIVEFQDINKYIVNSTYNKFKSKEIRNPYDKTLNNIGYTGVGIYNKVTHINIYNKWYDIFRRCYNTRELLRFPTYIGCTICEEWHNFQNFAKWFEGNYYEIDNEVMCLDKDILYKGNKIYSPETCILVPNRINVLFTKSNSKRGDHPIGVTWDKDHQKFKGQCNILLDGKKTRKRLGDFNTPEEGFYSYKKFKEQYIKEIADDYKDKIPNRLYDAMYRYEVEITD